MYNVIFYHDRNGKCELKEYLDELAAKAETSKNDRINRTKILAYISVLAQKGTRAGEPIVKHIEDDLWELRPMSNRILFFYWHNDETFVLLHHFTKKTQKTPAKELNKAKLHQQDFIERSGKK